nr:hypothetical protein [Deinococcus sp. ZS9-10]
MRPALLVAQEVGARLGQR